MKVIAKTDSNTFLVEMTKDECSIIITGQIRPLEPETNNLKKGSTFNISKLYQSYHNFKYNNPINNFEYEIEKMQSQIKNLKNSYNILFEEN